MAELIAAVYWGGQTYKPGDEVPADVAKELTNPALWLDGKLPEPAKAEPEPEQPEPAKAAPTDDYESMNMGDLKDEIELRTSRGHDFDVNAKANKAELIAALRANDAANA